MSLVIKYSTGNYISCRYIHHNGLRCNYIYKIYIQPTQAELENTHLNINMYTNMTYYIYSY